jgi:hypothetical protein
MAFQDPSFSYRVAIGGGDYGVKGVPHAFLIDVEGKIVWEGHPGSLPKEELAKALKAVQPSKDAVEARAKKRLAKAEKNASEKLFTIAESDLLAVKKDFPGTEAASKADEKLKEVTAGEEYAAQKKVAQAIGGVERPMTKIKGKNSESLSKKLEKMAQEMEGATPVAAKLARQWAELLSEPWK